MAEYYILKHDGGKVTAQRARINTRTKHWELFGKVDIYDLPIPEIRMAIEVQKVVERHRVKA